MSHAALMAGKRGLVMGVANRHSLAWGIAQTLATHGAELALSYQGGDAFARRVRPLAAELDALLLPCDVSEPESIDDLFNQLQDRWGNLDFLVHAIAYSDKSELKGRYANTSRENFVSTMLISCFSFTEVVRRAAPLMRNGGSVVTLTFGGSNRVMPNYNVMGVAKAGLEASVKYLASDFGSNAIRVNAISAGPIRTLAGAGIADARFMLSYQRDHAPLKRAINLEDVGGTAVYLLSDLSAGVTGEIHHVDAGYNIMCMPHPNDLRRETEDDVAEKAGSDDTPGSIDQRAGVGRGV